MLPQRSGTQSSAIFALTFHSESGSAYVEPARSACMSPSSPVRTRQPRGPSRSPQAESNRSPRSEAIVFVVRSILLVVAAVSVIATSDYLAYLIGRKQVTYEELRRQVDLVVQLTDQKRAEEALALTALKQRQEKLEQNASALTGLTTSTINGKAIVVQEPTPAGGPFAASPIDTVVAPPDREVRLQPPELPPNAATKHPGTHGVAHQRVSRRQKAAPNSAAPKRGPTDPAIAAQSAPTATRVSPDAGLAGQ
jgi:hypothetical protein